jgi:hypothetical protein
MLGLLEYKIYKVICAYNPVISMVFFLVLIISWFRLMHQLLMRYCFVNLKACELKMYRTDIKLVTIKKFTRGRTHPAPFNKRGTPIRYSTYNCIICIFLFLCLIRFRFIDSTYIVLYIYICLIRFRLLRILYYICFMFHSISI